MRNILKQLMFVALTVFGATALWAYTPLAIQVPPQGSIDNVSGGAGAVYVRGWTLDPNMPDAAVEIHVYLADGNGNDKKGIPGTYANLSRPDLDGGSGTIGYNYGTNHGFDRWISTEDLAPGTYYVHINAIDPSGNGSNPRLTYSTDPNSTERAVTISSPYTVSYNANGGSGAPGSQQKRTGINLTLSNATPSRTGYTFNGWNTASNGSGTNYAKGATYSANSGTTLYAKWTASTYTVTLNQQSGTGGTGSTTATYASAMPKITVPSRTGFTFQGYYTEANGKGTKYYNANGTSAKNWDKTSATTLYAYWTANTYTVTLDMQGGEGGSSSVTATYNADMPAITLPTRDGYFFNGYNDSEGKPYYTAAGESARKYDVGAALTLYAQWVDKSIPVPQPSGEWEAYMPAGNRMLRVTYKDEPELAWVDNDKQPVTAISGYHGFQSLVAIPNLKASNKFFEAVIAGTAQLELSSSNQDVVSVTGIGEFNIKGVGEADLAAIHRNDADFKYDSAAFHVTVLAPDTVQLQTNNAEWGTVTAVAPLGDSVHAGEDNKFFAIPDAGMTVQATPAEGFHLRYWSDGAAVATLRNTFSVQGNLNLLAFFAPDTVPAIVTKEPVIFDTLMYNGAAQTVLANGTAVGGQFKYSTDSATWSTALPQFKDAGTHTFYCYVDSTDVLHRCLPVEKHTVTIAKAPLNITAENKETVYGYAAPGFSVSYNGLQGSDLPADVLTGELSYACEYTVGSNAGEYDITPDGQTSVNYDITYNKGKLVVYKADPDFTAPAAKTLTYNGGAQTLVAAGITEHGTFEYTFTPNDGESWSTALPQAKNADTYGVYFRIVGDANHNDYESANAVTVTIAQAALTATADNKEVIYGDAVPAYTITYAGWQGEENESVLTGTIAYACEYAQTSNVGDYTIVPSGIEATNYAITFVNGKVTVSKAPLTITAENKEVTYGDEAPAFTASYEGWKNEDNETVVSGLAYTCAYQQGSYVGTYAINPNSATATNYAITFVDGTLTVNKATVFTSGAEAQIAKFEDGGIDAVVLNNGILNGIKFDDAIGIATTAAFNDAATGENKTITLSYELTGDAALLDNYDLNPTSEVFTTEAVIIEQMIPDEAADPEDEEADVKDGLEIYAYGYCDGGSYSIRYHLESGNPDQYKIEFDDSRFEDVDWTDLTVTGKEGTIDIDIPENLPTGDYRMTITFRDSRFTWLESEPITVSFHVNLPKTYTAVLFDNVISLVNTCNCLTEVQWYHRDSSDDIWQAIDGANGYYYRQLGGLTGEYFVSVKMNEVTTYTCPQTDMETLYGSDGNKIVRVNVVPNPVVDNATVTIEGSDKLTHSLSIINLMGAEMEYRTFEGDATTVEMGEYISGNYMISVDGVAVKVIKK